MFRSKILKKLALLFQLRDFYRGRLIFVAEDVASAMVTMKLLQLVDLAACLKGRWLSDNSCHAVAFHCI